jgi:hypothetical protein
MPTKRRAPAKGIRPAEKIRARSAAGRGVYEVDPEPKGFRGKVISIRRFFPTPVRDCSAIGLRWGC